MKKENGRDVAINFYNQLCDLAGIREDLRIDKMSEEEILELEEKGYSEEKMNELIEKSDSQRELIIRAFQVKKLEFNDKGELIQKLIDPVTKKDSKEIVLEELKWQPTYDLIVFEKNAMGIDFEKNMAGIMRAMIASRTGADKNLLMRLKNKDLKIAQTLNSLFQRAEEL